MQRNESRLTVYFDGVFWIGIYERIADGRLEACKITFGPEPKDYEVAQFLLQNWSQLRFSPAIDVGKGLERKVNPKRMQRQIRRQMEAETGAGTKAQQALKLQQEQGKQARRAASRAEREAEKERRFELQQEKRKEKHRGH